MYDDQSLSHTKWECKYHIIWIPKYRKKAIFGDLRKYLGKIFRELAKQKECTVIEGHLMPDHVHIMLSIPPKYSVAQIVEFIKGKSAIHIARNFLPPPGIFPRSLHFRGPLLNLPPVASATGFMMRW